MGFMAYIPYYNIWLRTRNYGIYGLYSLLWVMQDLYRFCLSHEDRLQPRSREAADSDGQNLRGFEEP